MKRIALFLARLYPKRWRTRYGEEFDALIDDARADWRAAADVFLGAIKMQFTHWSSMRITMATAAAGAAIALGISFAMPERWASQAVIAITEERPVYVLTTVAQIKARVESNTTLTEMINSLGLYQAERRRMPMEDVIAEMRRSITLKAIPGTGQRVVFAVEFDYPDRHVAQEVVVDLVRRITRANLDLTWLESQAARFELIDPPTLPVSPLGPNHALLAGSGLLAGAFAGMLLALAIRMRRKSHGICPTCGRPLTVTP